VYVRTDPAIDGPSSEAWWDVPVAEVSTTDPGHTARSTYEAAKKTQHRRLTPPTS